MREGIMTRVSHRASEALLSNESASDSRDGVSLPGVFNDPDPARGHEPDPTSIAFQPPSETSIHAASAVLLHQTAVRMQQIGGNMTASQPERLAPRCLYPQSVPLAPSNAPVEPCAL